MSQLVSILIADDHAMFAQSLANTLRGVPDMHIAGVMPSADKAVELAVEVQPDIVLLDIDMPGLSAFDAAEIVAAHCPNCAIIFVSAHTHDHFIEQALKVKAAGYVTKSEPPESVIAAIRIVAAGGAYYSPDVQARIVLDTRNVPRLDPPARTRLSRLTRRELDVLRLLAQGQSKRDIGKTLSIAIKTVESHTASLMDKLDIHDRVELALFAIREGLANP